MRVLDLFAGLGGWSAPWREAGHEVVTLDIEPRFGCDLTMDVRDLTPAVLDPFRPTVILASPPCETFSTGGFHSHHFAMNGDGLPRPVTEQGRVAVSLVEAALRIIDHYKPRVWVIENPRALLRKLDLMDGGDRQTVWYCHYGEARAKPTDLWGGFPSAFRARPKCHNRRSGHPETCCCHDHNPAPRGSVTGTQGMPTDQAAKIPYPLASELMLAAIGN